MYALADVIRQSGTRFRIIRENVPDRTEIGLKNRETVTGRSYIGFLPKTDIKAGDILVSPSEDIFYVVETETQFVRQEAIQLKAFIQSEREHHADEQSSAPTFNIQNAYGSVIGTNNQATINYNSAISELKERVASDASEDKEQLEKIVSLLEMVVNDQVRPSKGLFSRFSEVMERNSWIAGSVANAILNWLLSKTL